MNAGGLALCGGVLFWGRDFGRGEVRRFDLDGRALGHDGLDLGPKSSVSGLIVDSDRRLWVADTALGALRGFTLFGFEGAEFKPEAGELQHPSGGLTDGPVDVALPPGSTYLGLWVATGGVRRGAVGLFLADGSRLEALRSGGDPKRAFDRVRRLSSAGERLCVLEAGAGVVQVFRGMDYHFSFAPRDGDLRAAACLADGRMVVASGPNGAERVALFDGAGIERLVLAGPSGDEAEGRGGVSGVVDLVVEEAGDDRTSRLFVLDEEGARVQVFSLTGRCFGAFDSSSGWA